MRDTFKREKMYITYSQQRVHLLKNRKGFLKIKILLKFKTQ